MARIHGPREIPPVVVFGTGGSGTRLVARILEEAGCWMGDNLNHAYDNQDFGFLLAGRIDWMERHFPFGDSSARPYLELFEKLYFNEPLTVTERMGIARVGLEYLHGSGLRLFRTRPLAERFKRAAVLMRGAASKRSDTPLRYQRWGFKVPEAIYFLRPLVEFFPGIRLIHLVRDGRDIALSSNRKPLLYRRIFNIHAQDDTASAFENWCAVNRWASEVCKKALPRSQYMLIRYEDICRAPFESVNKILEFLQLKPVNVEKISNIPSRGVSIGRWQRFSHRFSGCDTSALAYFGYVQQGRW